MSLEQSKAFVTVALWLAQVFASCANAALTVSSTQNFDALEPHFRQCRDPACWLLQCKRYKESNLLCPADWNRAAWLLCGNDPMLATANADDKIVKEAWPETDKSDVEPSSSKRNRSLASARGFLIAPPSHHPVSGSFLVGVHRLRPRTCSVTCRKSRSTNSPKR